MIHIKIVYMARYVCVCFDVCSFFCKLSIGVVVCVNVVVDDDDVVYDDCHVKE